MLIGCCLLVLGGCGKSAPPPEPQPQNSAAPEKAAPQSSAPATDALNAAPGPAGPSAEPSQPAAGLLQSIPLKQGGSVGLRLAAATWELTYFPDSGSPKTYPMDWKAARGPARQEIANLAWGAGPPFESAWASGEESSYSSILLRPVQLDAATTAVLATQRGGFEHVKHKSQLLLPSQQGWKELWTLTEPAGPFFYSVEVTEPRANGQQDLLVVGGRWAENEGAADQAEARLFRWEGSAIKQVRGETVYQVVSADFPSLDAAHGARSRISSCLPGLFVIASNDQARIGTVISSAGRAEPLRRSMAACDEKLAPRVLAVKTR